MYMYMLTPPPRTNLSVFQNSKIPKNPVNFLEIPKLQNSKIQKFRNSKIPKFRNSKIPKFQTSKKIQSIFWNSNSQFPFGILEFPKNWLDFSGISQFWNFGISQFWNFGILELWNFGTLEFWNFGILEFPKN